MKTEYTEKDGFLQRDGVEHKEYAEAYSTEYLEKKLKLKVNTEKSRAVSVYSIRNFGFLALQWEGTETVHISEFTQKPRRKPKRS